MNDLNTYKPAENQNRFYRSVRLDTDINDINNIKGYSLTNHVLHVLGRIEVGIDGETEERAFTLTGPYGSGKSAFALYLSHLLDNRNNGDNLAFNLLKINDPLLARNYKSTLGDKGLCPVVLTLRRERLGSSIIKGLLSALHRLHKTKPVRNLLVDVKQDLTKPLIPHDLVLQRIIDFMSALPKRYRGVILVLDELGKALEYAAQNPGEDVYLLQELAEFAARSGEKPLLLFGILHQAFEQYGEFLDYTARQEWAKVQGRFCDIPFIEPPEQQIRLAVQAISNLSVDISKDDKKKIIGIAQNLMKEGYIPGGLDAEEVCQLALNSYPLHLTVLFVLPYLFKRFAQNERSLFAYLLSKETFGLQDQLAKNKKDFIRLPDLFDYFLVNVSGSILKQSYSRQWIEITDALERTPNLSGEEVAVLKTIGLLSILGESSFIKTTQEYISLSISDIAKSGIVTKCLESLQKKSLIVFRRYNKTYKIWEGSDIDIESRLEEGRRNTQGLLFADDLQKFLPNKPKVASRHSYEKGTMRYFELRYLDSPVSAKRLQPSEGMNGVIACCLPRNSGQINAFIDWISSDEISRLENVLFIVPQQVSSLRNAASELRAIQWVWKNTPELRDDRIARRELAERNAYIEHVLHQALQHILDPRPEPNGSNATWYYKGQIEEVKSLRSISELLSRIMDNIYHESPIIKNELINRSKISAAAAGARRNLIEHMLYNGHEPLLGIDGFPPERSIYDSILKASGIHQTGDQIWCIPTENRDPLNLNPTFKKMEEIIFNSIEEPYSVNKLQDKLSEPPIGLTAGVFPILFIVFLLSYPDEISLYREGVFIPEPNIADFEVLMRRPELYAVAGSRLLGDRKLVVQRIAKSLKIRPTTLSVTKALIGMVRSLPDHAWRTRRLPNEVIKLRTAFEQARSPERLLFVDIPAALNEDPFEEELAGIGRIERFFNKLNKALSEWQAVTQKHIKQAGNILLKACNLPKGEEGWKELIRIANNLQGKPLGQRLNQLIERLTMPNSLNVTINSVLALIAGRPPRNWTDLDIDNFPEFARVIGEEFIATKNKYEVLSDQDEEACGQLVERLKSQINSHYSNTVIRVALSRLLQDYD